MGVGDGSRLLALVGRDHVLHQRGVLGVGADDDPPPGSRRVPELWSGRPLTRIPGSLEGMPPVIAHTHILQGDGEGCRACESIRPESQVHPRLVPPLPVAYRPVTFELDGDDDDDPEEPDAVKAKPYGLHRIQDGRAVCIGGIDNRCHWYPGCDCEAWPCGHKYEFHEDCWVLSWLNAVDLTDTNDDWSARDDDGNWPNGVIDWEWIDADQGVTWTYARIDEGPAPTPPADGRRDSDVPLWEDDDAPDHADGSTT